MKYKYLIFYVFRYYSSEYGEGSWNYESREIEIDYRIDSKEKSDAIEKDFGRPDMEVKITGILFLEVKVITDLEF